MHKMTSHQRSLHLLLPVIFSLVTAISQPVAAQAQAPSTPPSTGKTLSAVLLGTAEPTNDFPWQVSIRRTAADAAPAEIPGVHKVDDVTLKRG